MMNASPKGPMCFRCLIFSLSGPGDLLFLLYCLFDLRSGECNVVCLYVLCCPVNGSVCFVCCVFDGVCELFGKTIRNMFGGVCYFVAESCCVWLLVLYWIDHAGSSIECVCCVGGPNERLDAPSICFVCVFVCRKLSPHLGV